MDYFRQFKSNTYAGSGNQLYFTMGDSENPQAAIYGGHPDEDDCSILADALYGEIKDII